MNEEEKQQLAKTVITEMDLLRPEDIRPWLGGFTSTHPRELVIEVNLLVKDDPTYRDVVNRMSGWHADNSRILVSWSHVSPETEASLRAAASWRSTPLSARNEWAKHGESMTWSHHFRRLGIPDRGEASRAASALWGDRAALNKKGVALPLRSPEPWPGEAAGVIDAIIRSLSIAPTDAQWWVVLCDDGKVLEGLPTWPR